MKTKRLITCAMLTAMYIVLSMLSLNLGNMKITVDSLPIIVGSVLFGPLMGALIGLLGSFLNQMLTFGFTATTLLWILPAGVRGLMVGLYAKQKKYELSRKNLIFILVASSLVVTTLNTGVIYLDSVIYGYYSFAYVFGTLILRYISGALTAVVLATIVPPLIKPLKKAMPTNM
ncbi:MAG: folate family ECF transporter S component [Angelakisella sp.]